MIMFKLILVCGLVAGKGYRMLCHSVKITCVPMDKCPDYQGVLISGV